MKKFLVSLIIATGLTILPAFSYAETEAEKLQLAEKYLISAVDLGYVDLVKHHLSNPETVKKELDPECPKNTRCKPVTYAAQNGSVPVMKLLLKAGADIEGKTGGAGDTPLIIALMSKHTEMVKFLVTEGADVHKPNSFGATPFWGASAMGNAELVLFFIKNSKDVNVNQTGRFPDPLKQKREIVTGITSLMVAAANGHTGVVGVLLDNEAKKDLTDSFGRTALEYAKVNGSTEIERLLK